MSTAGPNSPSTFATSDGGLGSMDWSTPSNAGSSDNAYATISTYGGGGLVPTYYLSCSNFGFSIPGGSTIAGITVEVERKSSHNSGGLQVADTQIWLLPGGFGVGDNKSGGAVWGTSDGYASFGGAADLWGLSLTPSDINASTFGVMLKADISDGEGTPVTADIDHVRITITYTEATAFPPNIFAKQAIKRASSY